MRNGNAVGVDWVTRPQDRLDHSPSAVDGMLVATKRMIASG